MAMAMHMGMGTRLGIFTAMAQPRRMVMATTTTTTKRPARLGSLAACPAC